MRDGYEATRILVETFRGLGIPHMVVGGISSNAYGIPRATKDADIVVALSSEDLFEMVEKSLAPRFVLDRQGSFETITGTKRFHVRVPSLAFEIELSLLSQDAHDQESFARRREVESQQIGAAISLPSPEDVIVMKLRWASSANRHKDQEDVRDIIAVQGDEALDWDYIHHWTAEHGTRDLLDQVRSSIPPLD